MLMKIYNVFQRICSVFLGILVAFTVLVVGCRFLGIHALTVLSGSMEPTYSTGALLFVKPSETDILETGDVITYLISDNTFVTHRIAGLVPDEQDPGLVRFRTKGDANDTEDMLLVHPNNVIGTPVFSIPLVGYAVNFIQNPPGIYITGIVASLLLMLTLLPDLFIREEEEETGEAEQGSAETK